MKKLFFFAVAALIMFSGCNDPNNKTAQVAETEPVVEQTNGIDDITVKDIDESDGGVGSRYPEDAGKTTEAL